MRTFKARVRAKDLQSSLGPELREDNLVIEAVDVMNTFGSPLGSLAHGVFCCVLQGGRPIGVLSNRMVPPALVGSVAENMHRLSRDDYVAPDTDFFKLIVILGKRGKEKPWLLTGQRAKILGVVEPCDLFELPGRMQFLELILGLEELALEYLLHDPRRFASHLSPGRKFYARQNLARSRKDLRFLTENVPEYEWLPMTTLIDKGTMLARGAVTARVDASEMKRVFVRAEGLRNACAHTGSASRLRDFAEDPRALASIVDGALWAHQIIRQALPSKPKRWLPFFRGLPVADLSAEED